MEEGAGTIWWKTEGVSCLQGETWPSWLPLARMLSPLAALLRGPASGTGLGQRKANKV